MCIDLIYSIGYKSNEVVLLFCRPRINFSAPKNRVGSPFYQNSIGGESARDRQCQEGRRDTGKEEILTKMLLGQWTRRGGHVLNNISHTNTIFVVVETVVGGSLLFRIPMTQTLQVRTGMECTCRLSNLHVGHMKHIIKATCRNTRTTEN